MTDPRGANVKPKFIVGNWKMHTNSAEARRLARAIAQGLDPSALVSVAVCPPFPYLAAVKEELEGSPVALGAQNVFPEKEGAHTGEVSPTMLLDLGCRYVIVGHSERRHELGESDAFIARKVRTAIGTGLDVIFCVGETRAQRESEETEAILGRQLSLGLTGLGSQHLNRLSVAYEPIWAIGHSGHQATPEQIESAHAVIRRQFGKIFGEPRAQALVIQYGGSVNPENAGELISLPGVDGALVGGASLKADEFLAIGRAASGASQTGGKAA